MYTYFVVCAFGSAPINKSSQVFSCVVDVKCMHPYAMHLYKYYSYYACYYPLVVQPLYIGADHPSYISKKVHKISVFMYFRPKKWILQVRFAP